MSRKMQWTQGIPELIDIDGNPTEYGKELTSMAIGAVPISGIATKLRAAQRAEKAAQELINYQKKLNTPKEVRAWGNILGEVPTYEYYKERGMPFKAKNRMSDEAFKKSNKQDVMNKWDTLIKIIRGE